MERRPLWPIAVGLVFWIGAAVFAFNDIWWPLIGVGVVSLGPGLAVGAMVLFTRRTRKHAEAMLANPSNDGTDRPSGPVAEPPQTRPSGARTNAKNAGRRRGPGGAAVLLVVTALGSSQGCEKIERARAERRARESADGGETPAPVDGESKPETTTNTTPSTATPSTAAPAEDPALEAALTRAITAPRDGEAMWRVDPFVAALVFERVRSGVAPTFSLLSTPIAEGPRAGFRVGEVPDGSLMHRLGLRTGDVIESLGGVELTDAGRIGFALDGAQNEVDLGVFRDGMSIVQKYRLTNALAWTGLLASFTGDPAAINVARPDAPTPAATPTLPTPSSGGTPHAGGGTKPTPGGGVPSPSTPSPSTPSASDPVHCETASKCTVTKAYFDKMVASPSALQSQATIVPAIQNDVHSGYKLKTVKAGSTVAKLGFRAGDKITHINGSDLTDELQAASLYFGLSGTSVFKVRFERGGASQVKTIVVD